MRVEIQQSKDTLHAFLRNCIYLPKFFIFRQSFYYILLIFLWAIYWNSNNLRANKIEVTMLQQYNYMPIVSTSMFVLADTVALSASIHKTSTRCLNLFFVWIISVEIFIHRYLVTYKK